MLEASFILLHKKLSSACIGCRRGKRRMTAASESHGGHASTRPRGTPPQAQTDLLKQPLEGGAGDPQNRAASSQPPEIKAPAAQGNAEGQEPHMASHQHKDSPGPQAANLDGAPTFAGAKDSWHLPMQLSRQL